MAEFPDVIKNKVIDLISDSVIYFYFKLEDKADDGSQSIKEEMKSRVSRLGVGVCALVTAGIGVAETRGYVHGASILAGAGSIGYSANQFGCLAFLGVARAVADSREAADQVIDSH